MKVLAVAAGLAAPSVSRAADATWNGSAGDGQWNTASNWTSAVPTGGTATFNNNVSTAINLASDLGQYRLVFDTSSVGSFTFGTTSGKKFIGSNSGQAVEIKSTVGAVTETFNVDFQITPTGRTGNFDWAFQNNSTAANLVFNGNVYANDTSATLGARLNVNGAGAVTVNGVVSDGVGPGGVYVAKSGNGTLTLANANTYSLGTQTTSGAGTIVVGNKSSFGSGQIRVIGGSSIIQASTALTGANAIANTINYVGFTNATATTSNLNVTTAIGSNTATWNSGTAPLVGDVVTAAGSLPYFTVVTGVSGTPGVDGKITFSNNANLATTAAITTNPFTSSATGTVPIAGTNAIEFSGTQNLTTALTKLTSGVPDAATITYNVTNTADTTFSGALQQGNNTTTGGSASVTKTGAGRLILSGTNTYTGTTTVSAGTLRLVNGAAIIDTGRVDINNAAGTLDLNGTSETIGYLTGVAGSSVTLGAATLTFSSNTGGTFSGVVSGVGGNIVNDARTNSYNFHVFGGVNTYTGTTTIANGDFAAAGNVLVSTDGPLGNSSSAIILGNANTVFQDKQPNVVLGMQTSGAMAADLKLERNIDSSTTNNVSGRTDIAFTNNTVAASGTLTVSGNWAQGVTSAHQYGLFAQQAGQTLDFTGIISGGATASTFRINDYGQGAGKVRLGNSSNSYAGQTSITAGTLVIGGNAGATSGVLGTNANLNLGESGNNADNMTAVTDGGYTVDKTINLIYGAALTSQWTLGGTAAAASTFTGNISSPNTTTNQTLNLNQASNGTSTFSGIINANAGTGVTNLAKFGGGTVILTNANTYDGVTTLSAGTLVANNATGSATSGGAVNVGVTGAAVSGQGGTIASATNAFSTRFITGISNAAAATLQIGQTITGTGTGGANIPAGSVITSISLGATTATISISNPIAVPASTTVTFADIATTSFASSAVLQLGNGGTTGLLSSAAGAAITMTSGSTFVVNRSNTVAQGADFSSAAIAGPGSFTQAGVGATTLNAANTYSGTTTVSAGSLVAGANAPQGATGVSGAFGNATTAIALGDAASVTNNYSPGLFTGGAFTIGRDITTGAAGSAGIYTIGGLNNALSGFSGTITLNRNLAVSQVATTGSNALALTGNIASGSGSRTLGFTNAGAVNQSTGVIGDGLGAIAVTKSGAGTTAFAGSNTYTGGTTVTGGTLLANGSGSLGSSGTTVTVTGVLGGTGSTGGPVTVGDGTSGGGGTITAGEGALAADAVGTLATGSQTWKTGGKYVVKFGSAGSDLLNMTNAGLGLLDLSSLTGGGFKLAVVNKTGSTFTPETPYKIASADLIKDGAGNTATLGEPLSNLFVLSVDNALYGTGDFTVTAGRPDMTGFAGDLYLNFTPQPAPEPTTVALVALGALPLAGRRRRRAVSSQTRSM